MRVNRDSLAEVGAFFLGTAAPTLTGPTANPGAASYWDDNKTHAATTVGQGAATGGTNDGTFTSGGTCSAPSAHSQACTSWCYGGDTLVYSFAGSVTQLTDQLTSVSFGNPAVAMTRVAKFPSTLVPERRPTSTPRSGTPAIPI
jgi:hypothetical protein